MKTMTLDERVVWLECTYGYKISRSTLRNYYLNHNIRYRTVDLHSTRKYSKADEIRAQQREFVIQLMHLQHAKYCWFIDSTSVTTWSNLLRKEWTDNKVGEVFGRK